MLSKLNKTFLFLPFRSKIEKINIKMYYRCFTNECSQFKNNVLKYLSLLDWNILGLVDIFLPFSRPSPFVAPAPPVAAD